MVGLMDGTIVEGAVDGEVDGVRLLGMKVGG